MAGLAERKKAVIEALTRESLIGAAEELLREEGWEGATMERLARKAGVAKGTVYNYFRDKRALLVAVVERCTVRLRHIVASCDDEADPAEVLRQVMRESFSQLCRNRRIIAALFLACRDEEGRGRDCDRRLSPLGDIRAFVRSVISLGVARGRFRPVDPALAEAVLYSAVIGLARHLSQRGLVVSEGAFAPAATEFLLDGLCARREEAPGLADRGEASSAGERPQ